MSLYIYIYIYKFKIFETADTNHSLASEDFCDVRLVLYIFKCLPTPTILTKINVLYKNVYRNNENIIYLFSILPRTTRNYVRQRLFRSAPNCLSDHIFPRCYLLVFQTHIIVPKVAIHQHFYTLDAMDRIVSFPSQSCDIHAKLGTYGYLANRNELHRQEFRIR